LVFSYKSSWSDKLPACLSKAALSLQQIKKDRYFSVLKKTTALIFQAKRPLLTTIFFTRTKCHFTLKLAGFTNPDWILDFNSILLDVNTKKFTNTWIS